MAIPASQIVNVTPRLIAAGGTDLVMNGLLLTTNSLIPTSGMVVSFTSADGKFSVVWLSCVLQNV